MAFPDGWQRRCSVTIPAAQVAGSLSDFPVLLTRDCLPDEMFSPTGGNAAQANGGDVRFTSDSAGTSMLPCEVVQFELDSSDAAGDAEAQVWVKVPSVSSVVNTTFYAWYSAGGGESQPAASDPAGRNAVWASELVVHHFDDDPSGASPQLTDSTGNGNDGTAVNMSSGDLLSGRVGNGWAFDSSGYARFSVSSTAGTYTFAMWVNPSPTDLFGYLLDFQSGRLIISNNFNLTGLGIYSGSWESFDAGQLDSGGTWYRLVVVFDGPGGTATAYVDGELFGTCNVGDVDLGGTATYARHNNGGSIEKMNGTFDESWIAESLWSSDRAAADYANQSNPATFAIPGTPTAADDEGGGEGPEEDDGDSGLTEDTDLEPLQYLFGPIGSGRPVFGIESVWATTVSHGRSVSEQRYSLQGRPYRRMSMTAYAGDRNESMSMQMMFARMGQRRFLAPLFADESPVTGSISPGAVTINCTTDYRRFFVGGRVVVYNRAYDGMWPTFAVGEIGTVGANSITLTSGVSRAFSSPAYVAPLIECELLPDISGNYLFFHGTDAQFTVIERVGDMSLPALVTPGSTPPGMTEYGGDPIFDVDDAMTKNGSSGWRREGSIVNTGLGTIPDMYGDRPRVECEIGLEFISRADAWAFLEFAESRAGRAYPFWMLHPGMSYEITAVNSSTSIQVRAFGRRFDWTYRPHIGIRGKDGAIQIRGVSSVSRANGTDTVTLDAALDSTPALADVDRCAPALHARFADDVIEERWQSIDLMRSSISVIEVLEEKSIEIAGIDRVETEGLDRPYDATKCPGVQGDQEPAPFTCPYATEADGPASLTVDPIQFVNYASCPDGVCNPMSGERTEFDGLLPRTNTCTWRVFNDHEMAGTELLEVKVQLNTTDGWWELRAVCGDLQVYGIGVYFRKLTGDSPVGVYEYWKSDLGGSQPPDTDTSCVAHADTVVVEEA